MLSLPIASCGITFPSTDSLSMFCASSHGAFVGMADSDSLFLSSAFGNPIESCDSSDGTRTELKNKNKYDRVPVEQLKLQY